MPTPAPRAESSRTRALDSQGFALASYALLALTFLSAVYAAASGQTLDAVVLLALIAGALAFIAAQERLPRIFTLLFVLAGGINAFGYVLNLWATPWWFDEFVHVYTPFAITAATGWLLATGRDLHPERHPVRFVAVIAALGLAIGILWEIFEHAVGMLGTRLDTLVDLACDLTGAILAGLFCLWASPRGP